jgi:hypothetical protein
MTTVRISSRFIALAAVTAALLLAAPAARAGDRPNITRVVVSRSQDEQISFRVEFSAPVTLDPERTKLQVALDTDRDVTTGVDGLEFALDWQSGDAAVLEAVNGEATTTRAPLDFRHDRTSATFAVPASAIGNPSRFDFYVFIAEGEDLVDEAPSHVLVSAGADPWTYPADGEPGPGEAYPTDSYDDATDLTLSERPSFLYILIGGVFGGGALLAVAGWGFERWRRRRTPATPPSPRPESLAARDRGDQADLLGSAEQRVDPARVAHVGPVHVDVHQRPQVAVFVEDEVGDGKRSEGGGDGFRLHLETALPAHFGGQHAGQQDYRQLAASTERMGGSCDAISLQLSPPSVVTNTEPLCVPK